MKEFSSLKKQFKRVQKEGGRTLIFGGRGDLDMGTRAKILFSKTIPTLTEGKGE